MASIGISSFFHDSAVACIHDGKVIFAAHEERYTRKKHDKSFPRNSFVAALKMLKDQNLDLDSITFFEKPVRKLERIIARECIGWPKNFGGFKKAFSHWDRDNIKLERVTGKILKDHGFNKPSYFYSEHHLSHILSSFSCSGFDKCIGLSIDGVGEWETLVAWSFEKGKISKLFNFKFPHSVGLLYSGITEYLGFKVNSGEYKVMGLAPYGRPVYREQIKQLFEFDHSECSFTLNMSFFDFEKFEQTMADNFQNLVGFRRRKPTEVLLKRHADLAASLQDVLNELVIDILLQTKKKFNSENLVLAGGVALNCVTNSKIAETGLFSKIFIQPAAGDAGGALGAAVFGETMLSKKYKGGAYLNTKFMNNIKFDVFCGSERPAFASDIAKMGFKIQEIDKGDMSKLLADLICDKKIVGVFKGRAEFGPRALGNTSIIAALGY